MSLTDREKQDALRYAVNGATFYFVPSVELSNMIVQGGPGTEEINDTLRPFLIQREAIKIEVDLVIRYCQNTLDSKNIWLLNHGDIKVIPQQITIN